MAAAARLDPKDYFTPEEWAPISARSWWKGPAMILHAWATIIAAGAMVVIWPITLPLAVMIIGASIADLWGQEKMRWSVALLAPLLRLVQPLAQELQLVLRPMLLLQAPQCLQRPCHPI